MSRRFAIALIVWVILDLADIALFIVYFNVVTKSWVQGIFYFAPILYLVVLGIIHSHFEDQLVQQTSSAVATPKPWWLRVPPARTSCDFCGGTDSLRAMYAICGASTSWTFSGVSQGQSFKEKLETLDDVVVWRIGLCRSCQLRLLDRIVQRMRRLPYQGLQAVTLAIFFGGFAIMLLKESGHAKWIPVSLPLIEVFLVIAAVCAVAWFFLLMIKLPLWAAVSMSRRFWMRTGQPSRFAERQAFGEMAALVVQIVQNKVSSLRQGLGASEPDLVSALPSYDSPRLVRSPASIPKKLVGWRIDEKSRSFAILALADTVAQLRLPRAWRRTFGVPNSKG